jgi:hypothetical protein
VRLALEDLEDRTVPTVVFNPHFGPETVTDGGGQKLFSPPVELVFWGSFWQTSAGSQLAADIENKAATLLSGPFLSHLTQYGSDGNAFFSQAVFDSSDPSNGFTDAQIRSVFNNQIDNNALPESDGTANPPIYLVLTPPNVQSNQAGALGYHSMDYDKDFVFGIPPSIETDTMAYGWVGGFGSTHDSQLDSYMSTMSHEVAEAMTDPQAGYGGNFGITTTQPGFPSPAGSNEIGDWEPDGGTYTYRVNGVLTQPYWSRPVRPARLSVPGL